MTAEGNSWQHQMEDFLRRQTPYTILPTPSPAAKQKELQAMLITDSATQDLISIVGACLHNLYDVPRAKQVFDDLRTSRQNVLLDVRMYNSLLGAYLEMARAKDTEDAEYWIDEMWALYEDMTNGDTHIHPTVSTYALMLLAWLRHGPESPQPLHSERQQDPEALLRSMVSNQVLATMVVSDRAFETSDEASQAIQLLSKAAVNMGLSNVVNELGMAESLGREEDDPLDDVPEVMPVKRRKKVDDVHVMLAEDGTVMDVRGSEGLSEPGADVPFNLDTLRKHLAKVIFARRVLPEDVAARQKLLEESVYDVAVERLKHTTDKLEDLGLTNPALKTNDLRQMLWDWHSKLKERLAVEIATLHQQEERVKRSSEVRLCKSRSAGHFILV